MRQEIMGFWDSSGIAQTISKQSASRSRQNHANTSSLNFLRLDAVTDVQSKQYESIEEQYESTEATVQKQQFYKKLS